jgi:acyl carrier protein
MSDATQSSLDVEAVRAWLIDYISSVLDAPRDDFPTGKRFDEFGIDSVEAVVMAGMLEEAFAVQVDPMQVFEHPSVDQLARALVAGHRTPVDAPPGPQ